MKEEAIIKAVLDEAFNIHKKIGPGLLENVYKTCLAYRLQKRGLQVETEKAVPVFFEEVKMECGYRADILVEKIMGGTLTANTIAEQNKIIWVLLNSAFRKCLTTTISSPPPIMTVVILPKGIFVNMREKPSAFFSSEAEPERSQNIPSHISANEKSGPTRVGSHKSD